MIKYKSIARKNPKTGVVKYYAAVSETFPMTLDDLCERIADGTTVTRSAVKAVISALERHITLALQDGRSVRLGDLGSFHITITSSPSDTSDEVNDSKITGIHVNFSKSGRLRKEFRPESAGIHFYRTDKKTKTSDEKSIEDSNIRNSDVEVVE